MESDSWLFFFLLILFIFGGSYFAATEIAFASSNKLRIRSMADGGDLRARKAMYILNHFDKALTTLLIGNNIMHIAAASIATVLATRLWGEGAVTYSTIVITIVVFLVSEMIPKSFAKSRPERFALMVSGSLYALMKLFTPLNFFFTGISGVVSKLFTARTEPTVTEEELYEIIDTIEEEGTIDESRSDLIRSALEFDDITVSDVLTSRVDLITIDIDMTLQEVLETVTINKFSRLPVYEGTIDNIIGILNVRKFLKTYLQSKDTVILRNLIDEPHFVPKSTPVDELLEQMSTKKFHMSVVTDDYGGTMGIVTSEDILEELVGEIWDEDDEVKDDFHAIGGGRFEVSGGFAVVDAFDEMDFEDFERDDFGRKTMNAWALENFDYIPEEGSSFLFHGLTVTVSRIRNLRITKLIVRLPEPEQILQAQ